MALNKLIYRDFEGEPREWSLGPIDFGAANLVVGRNSTGKSRLINIITALMGILSGQRRTDSLSKGHFWAEFEIGGNRYEYELNCETNFVSAEKLSVNGIDRMSRSADGKGRIYYQKQDDYLDFEIDRATLALQARNDRLQHPYISTLSEWATASATYAFGRGFLKNELMSTGALSLNTEGQAQLDASRSRHDPNNPLATYVGAFQEFGLPFDQALVEDMRFLGFPITEVHASPFTPNFVTPVPPGTIMALTVMEEGVVDPISQIALSDGMYRALALLINLNWTIFSGRKGLLLIDDLGEGLDYERSCNAIELTMRKAQESGCQVIVTSNDRFVMNSVPLKNWVALKREGAVVKGFTQRNSPEAFDNFRFTGLSNFDFFTSEAFH